MRQRTVFDSQMVAHVWAEQAQHEGRVQRGNFYFRDGVIYSYGGHFPIAQHVKRGKRAAVFFTTRTYSVTTANHLSMVRGAIARRNLEVFNLHPDAWGTDARALKLAREDYAQRLKEAAEAASRARSHAEWKINAAEELAVEANRYAEFMGQRWRVATKFTPEFLAEMRARVKRDEQRKARDRAAAEARRREQEAEARKEFDAALVKWLAGESVHLSHYFADTVPVRLRLRGEVVETTLGAEVPADHARRLWPIIQRVRATGQPYQRNGHTVHVGHFAVDKIDAAGNLTAGCHFIEAAEVDRFAAVLGLTS